MGGTSWTKQLEERTGLPLHEWLSSMSLFSTTLTGIIVSFVLLDWYTCFFITSSPDETTLPLMLNISEESSFCVLTPFCKVGVKGVMLDPPDFYGHDCLSKLIVKHFDLTRAYLFLTPNMVSISHVFIALLSAKLMCSDSLFSRRLGVMLFQLRNLLDSLDGVLAKRRRKAWMEDGDERLYSDGDLGYWVDGICDGLGQIFVFIACLIYLKSHPLANMSSLYSYHALPIVHSSKGGSSAPWFEQLTEFYHRMLSFFRSLTRRCMSYVGCGCGVLSVLYGFQALFSCAAWNHFILGYSEVLERSNGDTESLLHVKSVLIRSPVLWLLLLTWRYINPHFMIDVLLLAIFFDKLGDFLFYLRHSGYALIFLVSGVTAFHLHYIKSLLSP